MINILVMTTSIFSLCESSREIISSLCPQIRFMIEDAGNATTENIRQADIIFGSPSKSQIAQAKQLRWLQLPTAGAERYIDKDQYCREDIIITNSSGVFGIPIAEHVFALILAFNRNIDVYTRMKDRRKWLRQSVKSDIHGSTFGIIGLGDIGNEVAKRAFAMGARVIAVRRTPGVKPGYVEKLYGVEGIDDTIAQSDYVVLSLPATAKTTGIITRERIALMKKNAFIVNIGRGSAIDQNALIEALTEGRIAGAGLDVALPEPLPEDSILWTLPNVILTPHSSGDSPTNNIRRDEIFIKNLKHFIRCEPLDNRVSFEHGY